MWQYHYQQLIQRHAAAHDLLEQLVAEGLGFLARDGLEDALKAAQQVIDGRPENVDIMTTLEAVLQQASYDVGVARDAHNDLQPPESFAPFPPPVGWVPPDHLSDNDWYLAEMFANTLRETYQFLVAMRNRNEYNTQDFANLMRLYQEGVRMLKDRDNTRSGVMFEHKRKLLGAMATHPLPPMPQPLATPPAPAPMAPAPAPAPAQPPVYEPSAPGYSPDPPPNWIPPPPAAAPDPSFDGPVPPLAPAPAPAPTPSPAPAPTPSPAAAQSADPRVQAGMTPGSSSGSAKSVPSPSGPTKTMTLPEAYEQAVRAVAANRKAIKEWLDKYAKASGYQNIVEALKRKEQEYLTRKAILEGLKQDPNYLKRAQEFYHTWATEFDQVMVDVMHQQEQTHQEMQAYLLASDTLAATAASALELLRELITWGLSEEAGYVLQAITQAHTANNVAQSGPAIEEAQRTLETVAKSVAVTLQQKKQGM